MIENQIISKSISSWRAPITMPKKKDGSRRFCVDFRQLNKEIVPDRYPLPIISELIERLSGCRYFSSLDINNAYWHIPINEQDKVKTAFTIGPGHGVYHFNVMPFGMANAPSTFQRILDNVLGDFEFCCCYIDDIIIFSKTIKEHYIHLEKILSTLEASGFKLSPNKCHIAKEKIDFLGYQVSSDGIEINQDRIKPILEWNRPKDKRELQRFLGSVGYFQKFMKNFSSTANPLYDLIKRDSNFVWKTIHEESFIKLKNQLMNLPKLRFPDEKSQMILKCDASDRGLAAVLVQERNNGAYPVSFAGRKLSETETKYCATDKELLAIKWGLEKFRPYVLGRHIIIETDHNPLVYLNKFKDSHNKRSRWLNTLSEYDFSIRHVNGKDNILADAISRCVANVSEMQVWQASDEETKKIIQCLVNPKKIEENLKDLNKMTLWKYQKKLIVVNNLLFYKGKNKSLRIIVPNKLKNKLIKDYHEKDSGHAGVEKLVKLLKDRYFWPKMECDIKVYIKSCQECQERKNFNSNHKASLVPMVPTAKFKVWQADILGPLPESSSGRRFVILFVDQFSKWVEAFPISIIDSITVLKCLRLIISRYGYPYKFHTDQGKQFEAKIIYDFCKNNGIEHTHSSPYHPEGNGLAERTVQTFKQKLKLMVGNENEKWDEKIPDVLLSMRITNSKATGYSPAEIIYGVHLRTKSDTEYIKNFEFTNEPCDVIEVKARGNLTKHITDYKNYYDKKTSDIHFNSGDQVLLKNPIVKGFEKLYNGPYEIVNVNHPNYKLKMPSGEEKTVHQNRLKLFYQNTEIDTENAIENEECDENDKILRKSKRKITIPKENVEYVKEFLPSIWKRGEMSDNINYVYDKDNNLIVSLDNNPCLDNNQIITPDPGSGERPPLL